MTQKNQHMPKGGARRLSTNLVSGCLLGLGVLFFATVHPNVAAAQVIGADQYDGGKARVSLSDNLRMLSEAVASASCRYNAQISPDTALPQLATAINDFNIIITALEHGNTALGIPTPETNPVTVNTVFDTLIAWSPLAASGSRMVRGEAREGDPTTIRDNYAALFDQSVVLAAHISGRYSNPLELLQSDATVLNFALRQRALAHRISRAMCELTTDTGNEQTLSELETTIDLFDRTLTALQDGLPDVGISPPPNDAVRASLASTRAQWVSGRAVFSHALSGETPTVDETIAAAELAAELTVSMNNAITLYLISTPGRQGVYRVPVEAYARSELKNWLSNPELIDAIKAQNDRHATLTTEVIAGLEDTWRAEFNGGDGSTITSTLTHPVSAWLKEQQAATAGFVTEVFIMDNQGLNVAQTNLTPNYWHGDDEIWRDTYQTGPDALHIGDVEFNEGTGFFQTQVSLAVTDPETGAAIGAVAFGINVQYLM
jgi:hypothetical protein